MVHLTRGVKGGSDIGGQLTGRLSMTVLVSGDQVVKDISSISHMFGQFTLLSFQLVLVISLNLVWPNPDFGDEVIIGAVLGHVFRHHLPSVHEVKPLFKVRPYSMRQKR